MKYLVESFPYKPRQTVYYVRDNAIYRGVIVYAEVKCIYRSVDRDKVLIDYCDVHILPDSEINKEQPTLQCVSSDDVHFMFESCEHQLNEVTDKEYDKAFENLEPYVL